TVPGERPPKPTLRDRILTLAVQEVIVCESSGGQNHRRRKKNFSGPSLSRVNGRQRVAYSALLEKPTVAMRPSGLSAARPPRQSRRRRIGAASSYPPRRSIDRSRYSSSILSEESRANLAGPLPARPGRAGRGRGLAADS